MSMYYLVRKGTNDLILIKNGGPLMVREDYVDEVLCDYTRRLGDSFGELEYIRVDDYKAAFHKKKPVEVEGE